MQFPNFNSDQFIDANSENTGFALAATSLATLAAGGFQPGLLFQASTMTLGITGLAVTVNLPSPFGVLFGTGILSQAHGTVTGSDTQAYAVNFSGAVPGSGSTTAYVVASYQQIQQSPIAIIGPPPGHPDYNPNFVPYTGYTQNVDSLAVNVNTTGADNVTTFELFRTTLAAGATGISATVQYTQPIAPVLNIAPVAIVNPGGSLTGGKHNVIAVSGSYNLPNALPNDGLCLVATNTAVGNVTLNTGGGPVGGLPFSTTVLTLGSSGTVMLLAEYGTWQIIGGNYIGISQPSTVITSPVMLGGYLQFTNPSTLTYTPVAAAPNGAGIWINGFNYLIPNAGVTLSNAGLVSGTTYYIYAQAPGGTLGLAASSTNYTYNNGVPQQNGLPIRTLVGLVVMDPSGNFQAQGVGTVSAFNAKDIFLTAGINGINVPLTTATPSASEITSGGRSGFTNLFSRVIRADVVAVASMSTGAVGFGVLPSVDSTNQSGALTGSTAAGWPVLAGIGTQAYGWGYGTPADGGHYITVLGAVNTPGTTATFTNTFLSIAMKG